MSSSLFSSFQENTKCESSFFADTCARRVPIFNSVTKAKFDKLKKLETTAGGRKQFKIQLKCILAP